MYKTLSVIVTCLLAMIAFACAGGGAGNPANSANNAAAAANIDANHMPAGLSTSPLPVNGTTPGIPDPSMVNLPMNVKGGTPTPGIPDPAHVQLTPNPKGTPTPGIPSPAEIKKMMQQSGNPNAQTEANTPSQGNLRPRDSMKQMQMRKKPQ